MDKEKSKTILIVEDEAPLLKILAAEFSGEGFSILEARDGKKGLAVAIKEKPDLILLDLLMPEMDGMEMLKRIREDEWGRTANVLILTNLEGDATKTVAAIENGVFEFIIKSRWTLEDLKERVKEKLAILEA